MKHLLFLLIVITFATCSPPTQSQTNAPSQQQSISQTPPPSEEPQVDFALLPPASFKKTMESLKDYHLIDIRTAGEVAQGTLPNSVNLDFYNPNFKAELNKLDKNKPLLLFCRSGNRSGQATAIAKEMGFKAIYDMQGGMIAWQQSGL